MVEESKIDDIKEYKQISLNNISKECPEMIRGDKKLFDNTTESKFSKEQLNIWYKTLQLGFPSYDEGLLKQILELYAKHPDIVADVCNEARSGVVFPEHPNSDNSDVKQ